MMTNTECELKYWVSESLLLHQTLEHGHILYYATARISLVLIASRLKECCGHTEDIKKGQIDFISSYQ